MATRSTIAIEYLDGTVRQVYCHWDGYLENNGKILEKYFSNPNKLNQIMDLGDLSVLGSNIGTKHNFDLEMHDMCKFYGRDRGENNIEAKRFANFEDYKDNARFEEFNYILRFVNGNSIWFVSHYDSGNKFESLTNAFERTSVESLK